MSFEFKCGDIAWVAFRDEKENEFSTNKAKFIKEKTISSKGISDKYFVVEFLEKDQSPEKEVMVKDVYKTKEEADAAVVKLNA